MALLTAFCCGLAVFGFTWLFGPRIAGLLAIMMLTGSGGTMDSLAMPESQSFYAQAQVLSSPDKIIICLLYTSPKGRSLRDVP